MQTTPENIHESHIHALLEDVFGPVRPARGSARHRLLLARSILAYLGLLATLVQIVVWVMIGVITTHLDTPWWLWTAVPAALGVGALTLVDRWHDWYAAAAGTDDTTEVSR